MGTTFAAGTRATATALNYLGMVARGVRTSSDTATTEAGVLRIDDIPLVAGRSYEIWANPEITSSVAADGAYVRIRYTTDGSTPTTSSAVLPGASSPNRIPAATNGEGRILLTNYEPAGAETLSLLLTLARYTGSGTITITGSASQPLLMVVKDVGTAVGDVGVDV